MSSGEERGWEILGDLDPADVCNKAQVVFDEASGLYSLGSFNWTVSVSPGQKRMFSDSPGSDILLVKLGYFSRLSILWYLVGAKGIPLSGRLVRPDHIRGGHLFFRGTHVLPLERLAETYGKDLEGFLLRGSLLGAERQNLGDASLRLFPLPRVPVTVILWAEDEEFPARADVLFDSTCEHHLPIDIVWSVAMMSVLTLI